MKVWIATVKTGFGMQTFAGKTENDALYQVYQYCREWWEDWCEDQPMPANKAELIERYFDSQDSLDGESYEVSCVDILDRGFDEPTEFAYDLDNLKA